MVVVVMAMLVVLVVVAHNLHCTTPTELQAHLCISVPVTLLVAMARGNKLKSTCFGRTRLVFAMGQNAARINETDPKVCLQIHASPGC